MKSKSFVRAAAILLVVCMFMGVTAFADGVQTRIYSEKSISANVGETFELPIYIENNPGIFRFTISITYDKKVIEPVEGSEKNGEIAPMILANPSYMNKPDTRVGSTNFENFNGDGLLFSYKFRVKDTQVTQTAMNISVANNSVKRLEDDLSISAVDCTTEPCTIQIGGQTTAPTIVPTEKPDEGSASAKLKENASEIKYIMPVGDKIFEPDRAAIRYEVVEALYELLDFENLAESGSSFSDLDSKHIDMVGALSQTPIISGYPDGTFGGEANITRAEFVKVMAMAVGVAFDASVESGLSDIDGHWAKGYIAPFVGAGYIYGYPDNTFMPEANVTRAEAVAIINRVIGKKATSDAETRFDDIDGNHWAYGDVMAAVK